MPHSFPGAGKTWHCCWTHTFWTKRYTNSATNSTIVRRGFGSRWKVFHSCCWTAASPPCRDAASYDAPFRDCQAASYFTARQSALCLAKRLLDKRVAGGAHDPAIVVQHDFDRHVFQQVRACVPCSGMTSMKAGSFILARFFAAIMPQMKIPPVDMKVSAQSPVLAPYRLDKNRQSLLANGGLLFLRRSAISARERRAFYPSALSATPAPRLSWCREESRRCS